ncbi:hypothetical protein MT390_19500 [Vibrio sp. 2-Bac 85]
MRTESYTGHVEPGVRYTMDITGLIKTPEAQINVLPKATTPRHCILDGEWDETVDLTIEDANILGGNGRYLLSEGNEELNIPIAECTAENLAFYGSQLLKMGDSTYFEADAALPVTVTAVGKDYVNEYLLDSNLGGGAYLETHDRPHFHMPLDDQAGGYLIVGKENEDGQKLLSAFKVPFGFGVHMAPWAIHADSYLLGRYLVIYSATPSFSTVIVRKKNGELASITFS